VFLQIGVSSRLNVRGFSGAVIGTQFVLRLAFDTAEAAQKAIAVLRQ